MMAMGEQIACSHLQNLTLGYNFGSDYQGVVQ
jgi:hypothetical protein